MIVPRPPVRKIFIPEPGYDVFDADLSGADAQVVAWEAEDDRLKAAFRSGIKVHAMNAEDIFGTRYTQAPGDPKNKHTKKGRLYDDCKRAVHGTNYGASARTIAATLGWLTIEADDFQHRWFSLHPRIKRWHQRTDANLRKDRTVRNRFGYYIIYYDRIDSILPEALAWLPQSTVAIATFKGAERVDRVFNPEPDTPWSPRNEVRWHLQVHDSLVFQVKKERAKAIIPTVMELLPVVIPYDDPLTIPWKLTGSEKSWGDCDDKHPVVQALYGEK